MTLPSKLFIVVLMLAYFASCKKKEDDPVSPTHNTSPDCMLTSIIHNSSGGCRDSITIVGFGEKMSGTISFDNCSNGGIPGPVVAGSRRFIYEGNRMIVIDTSAFAAKDTLILEAGSLRILEIHRKTDLIPQLIVARYEYAGNGTLQRSITFNDATPIDTTTYFYSDGDMVMQVSTLTGKPDTLRFSYYTDKKVPINGYATQSHIGFGNAYTLRNAHLRKGELDQNGNLRTLYTYESDSHGNIARVIASDQNNPAWTDTTNYRYVCAVE